MGSDGAIKIDTTLDSGNVDKELKNLKASLAGVIEQGVKLAKVAVAFKAIKTAVGAISGLVGDFTELTSEIYELSNIAGVSSAAFQELAYAADQYGVSQDALADGLKELQLRADEFVDTGGGTAAEAFATMGYNAEDLTDKLQDVPGFFTEIIEGMGDLDKASQIRVADELFGGAGAEAFPPLIDAGAASIQALREEAQELGVVMSGDVINAGVELEAAMTNLKSVGGAIFDEVFGGIAPYLTESANAVLEWIQGNGGIGAMIGSLAETFADIIVDIRSYWLTGITAMQNAFDVYVSVFKAGALGMKAVWVTEISAIKIALLTIGDVIQSSVLASIESLLTVLSYIPGIGDNFAEAAEAVSGFSERLSQARDEAVSSSAEAIKSAWAEAAAVKDSTAEQIQARNEAAKERIEELEQINEANDAAREAERKASEEALSSAAEEKAANEARISKIQDLLAINTQYQSAITETAAKAMDGYITQEEAIEANRAAAMSYADALYSLGVTASSAAEDGGDALREMLEILSDEASPDEAEVNGEEVGTSYIAGIATGIESGLTSAVSAAENVISTVSDTVTTISSSISSVISSIADFDADDLWDSFEELVEGIEDFFYTDLGALSVYAEAGAEMIAELISGMLSDWDSISETIENVITTVVEAISSSLPDFLELGADLLVIFLEGIVSNLSGIGTTIKDIIEVLVEAFVEVLPYIISIGGEIIEALIEGITENAEALVSGVVTAVSDLITYIAENLDMFIDLGIDLMVAIIEGFADALPDLVTAIIAALPEIYVAFLLLGPKLMLAAPEIIAALLEGLVLAIIEMPGALIGAIVDVFTEFIDAIKDFFGIHSPSTVFYDFGENIIQGLINGILDFGSSIWSSISSVFSGILDSIVDIFSGMFDLGVSIIEDFVDGINSVTATVTSTTSSLWDGITDFFGFANGTSSAPGGLSIVGERGPELVNLPTGSQVYTASQTSRIMAAGNSINNDASASVMSGATSLNLTIDVPLEVDGVEIARVSYEYMDEVAT
ncbi:MAG: hypothetical protein PQJ60_10670 [Spirochaetales bacterium]|nr:hypothetical protein [Spirochaetales bacterium]